MKRLVMLFLAGATLLGSLASAATNYELLKKVAVAGAGGWDYVIVDEAARRVYITHATQVDVMDADSLAVVGTIPNIPGAHGVAIATEFGRGYITAGKADAVIPFDLKTLKTFPEIKVGKKPDAIVYEPFTKRVYVMNGDSDSISVLNGADGSLAGTIDLGGGPEYGVSDGKGNFYVNLEEKNETLHIDVKTLEGDGTLAAHALRHAHRPIDGCRRPPPLRRLPQQAPRGAEFRYRQAGFYRSHRGTRGCGRIRCSHQASSISPPAMAKSPSFIRIRPTSIPSPRNSSP